MDDKPTTFWELLSDNDIDKVDIPKIQRDYAQGRIEEAERRENFLKAISEHLRDDNPLHLDFIYGRIEQKTKFFCPIDGQQRLTTLFLLHWYFGVTEKKFDELKILKKFSYDTRLSSREFCVALGNKAENISTIFEDKKEGNESIPDLIKDFSWFKYGWEDDPTISSMLVMIEAIHNKFKGFQDGWSKLVDKKLITFEVLDLGKEEFELADELYIKMNARGKQLTPFENFKAEFIDFLGKKYGEQTEWDYEISNEKRKFSYSEYFSYKIEKEWCDLFWAYYKDEDDLSTPESPIDNKIMNFIYVIAQLCYFKDNKDRKAEEFKQNLEITKEVFGKKENIDFLFFILDCLHSKSLDATTGEVSKNVLEDFFATFFLMNENQNQNERQDDKYYVNISWNAKSESSSTLSLFSQCINEGLKLDARNKILLYCMFSFIHNKPNGRLDYYLRVIRNLLYAIRQRNETKYNTNVRVNEFEKYWKLFEQLQDDDVYNLLSNDNSKFDADILKDSLEHEKQKAKLLNEKNRKSLFALEDQSFLFGYLRNFDLKNNADKINEYAEIVPKIFNYENKSLVVRALIASDFEGVWIRPCALGHNYYFGSNWETVLTYAGKNEELNINLNDSLVKFLNNYISRNESSVETKLQGIIDDWLKANAGKRGWRYYFIKYKDFTDNELKSNYYCWNVKKEKNYDTFQIEMLSYENSNPLSGYHKNAFIYTVCELANNSNSEICEKPKRCDARYKDESFLYLEKNKKHFYCRDEGLEINDLSGITKDMLEKYNIDENEKRLKPNENMDMIEVAVAFLKDLDK